MMRPCQYSAVAANRADKSTEPAGDLSGRKVAYAGNADTTHRTAPYRTVPYRTHHNAPYRPKTNLSGREVYAQPPARQPKGDHDVC